MAVMDYEALREEAIMFLETYGSDRSKAARDATMVYLEEMGGDRTTALEVISEIFP